MKEKVKHHTVLIAFIIMGVFYMAAFSMGTLVNLAWWSLAVLGLVLYILSFFWSDRCQLVCPQCNDTAWNKTQHYCSTCGVKMVFRDKQKIRRGEKVKLGKIPEPCCSHGHRVYASNKYCKRCGEKLT